MSKTLSGDTPASLERHLNSQVQELRRLLPRALKAKDVKAVHQARVTTRRLRAAVQLTKPILSGKPRREFSGALRRLRRTLGPLRDVDVMLLHLEDLRGGGHHADAVEWFSGQLRTRRAKLARKCCKKMSSARRLLGLKAWTTLRAELRDGESSIRRRATRAVPEQLAAFRECADQVWTFRRKHSVGLGPDVHELRIAGKLLRYTLELATPLGYELSPAVLRSFKRLQEALGLWHDYVVLGEHALRAAMDELLSLHHPQLYGQLLELARLCWVRSERELDRFTQSWARDGKMLASAILATFKQPAERDERRLSSSRAGHAGRNGDPGASGSDQNGETTTTTTRSS